MSGSALYLGGVMHQRLRPVRHALRYAVFYLLLDLDDLPQIAARLRLFSLDRFNLFSFHQRDHGAGEAGGLRRYVDQQLAQAGLAPAATVRLLAMPRVLGYAFNPLSVYFCSDAQGRLQAILYEVNNTFGQRHSYLAGTDPHQEDAFIEHGCAKAFHVSPFLALQMRYAFRVQAPAADRPGMELHITASDAGGAVLVAQLRARRRGLTDAALAAAFFMQPLLTLKVTAAIHWEALALWLKGVRLQPRPAPPPEPMTRITPTQDP
jgi:DUF1365 family protein